MRLQFILSEIWIGLRRNLSMAISVALVTMVSVLFLGLGVLAQRQVDTMKDYWYDRIQVSIFLCTAKSDRPNCSSGAITALQRKALASQLDSMKPLVRNVFHESQQEAYDRAKEQYPDSPSFRDIKPEQLPESLRVQLSDPTKFGVIASSFIGAPGVAAVEDQRRLLDPLFNVLRGLSFGALAVAGLMVLCSVLLVATTIRQTAFSRRRETGIMRLVGASAFIIQLPFILETLRGSRCAVTCGSRRADVSRRRFAPTFRADVSRRRFAPLGARSRRWPRGARESAWKCGAFGG